MSVEQRCLRRHPAKTGFLRPLKSVCKTVSSKCPSLTISKWTPHTAGAPALHGAGSLCHFCLYPRPDSECEATHQPPRASPPVTGGQCGGTKSLFQSPHRPNPPLYLLLLRGGSTGTPCTRQRGHGRQERSSGLASTQGSRSPDGILRGCGSAIQNYEAAHAAVRGRPPIPSVCVCLRHDCLCGRARRGHGVPSACL